MDIFSQQHKLITICVILLLIALMLNVLSMTSMRSKLNGTKLEEYFNKEDMIRTFILVLLIGSLISLGMFGVGVVSHQRKVDQLESMELVHNLTDTEPVDK